MEANYLENYLNSVEDIKRQSYRISDLIKQYVDKDDYADSKDWLRAHAVCRAVLELGLGYALVEELFAQLNKHHWFYHSFISLNDTDYTEWFQIVKDLNEVFIAEGCYAACLCQNKFLRGARIEFRNIEEANAYFLLGVEKNDPDAVVLSLYEAYSEEQDVEKREDLLKDLRKRAEEGNLDAEFYAMTIAYSQANSEEEAWNALQAAHRLFYEEKKCLYYLAGFYAQTANQEKEFELLQLGMENDSYYCRYLLAVGLLNGKFADKGITYEQVLQHLELAFDFGILDAALILGREKRMPSNGSEPQIEAAKVYFEKLLAYAFPDAYHELATIYIYEEEYKDLAKAVSYLDQAIEQGNSYAMAEKAYHILENEEFGGDFQMARELLENSSELGNMYATYRLGVAYQDAEFGAEPDYEKALEFFELAAEHNNSDGLEAAARYYRYMGEPNPEKAVAYFQRGVEYFGSNFSKLELALCYIEGFGVEQDYKQAETLLLDAYSNDYPYAALQLGYLYQNNDFEGVDDRKGFEYFKLAADAGSSEGVYQLACCYRYQKGCEENPEKAVELFQQALEMQSWIAYVDLGLAYEAGYGGLEESLEKAFEYFQKAAEYEFSYAQYKLGIYLFYGYLAERNIEKAREWFEKSYANGSPYAALMLGDYCLYDYDNRNEGDKAFEFYRFAEDDGFVSEGLGLCYEFGVGVGEDHAKAFSSYQVGAKDGYPAALYRLGLCYYNGKGTPQDKIEAIYYLKQAADAENLAALTIVGEMLMAGDGVEKDLEEGLRYLRKAADADSADAQYELGNAYLKGEGVQADDDMAMKWYQKAAENGNEEAQKIVGFPFKRRLK